MTYHLADSAACGRHQGDVLCIIALIWESISLGTKVVVILRHFAACSVVAAVATAIACCPDWESRTLPLLVCREPADRCLQLRHLPLCVGQAVATAFTTEPMCRAGCVA